MGWQTRATGRMYGSLSGHGYMIGCKVISMEVLCKKCSTCRANNKKGIEPPPHPCLINHTGSSGGMEAKLCCQLLEEMYDTFDVIVVIFNFLNRYISRNNGVRVSLSMSFSVHMTLIVIKGVAKVVKVLKVVKATKVVKVVKIAK